jgi:hypothetical protein
MAGLIPAAPVAQADPANQAPPGTPGTEQAPTQAPPPGASPDDTGDAGQGGLIPGEQAPDPSGDETAGPTGQALNSAAPGDVPRMAGTVQDAKDAAVDADPNAEVEASPEEQAEYDQLLSRFLLFISDTKQPQGGGKSASDTMLEQLNNPKIPLATAIGTVTAHIVYTIVSAASHQKVTYSPDVLLHAAEECVSAVYLLGLAGGIIKGMPPFKGMPDDGDYDFEDSEIQVIGEAQMQAVKEYGSILVKTGDLSAADRTANQDFWKKQIAREVSTGNVSDDVLSRLQAKGAFDKVHAHMGQGGMPDPSSGQPPAQPDPSAQAPAPAAPDASAGSDPNAAAPPDDGSGGGAPPPDLVPPDADAQPAQPTQGGM